MKQNKLIVFSAPSGSGKTTIVHHLLSKKELSLDFSISATSRERRKNEIPGKDYYFLSSEDFKKHISQNDFIEWEQVYTNDFYGTLKSELSRIWNSGKNVIFDIDVIGGLNIKRQYPKQTLAIFVKPKSIKEIERRLRRRKTDSESKILERIVKAEKEIPYAREFDVILINDILEDAKKQAYDLTKNFITSSSTDNK